MDCLKFRSIGLYQWCAHVCFVFVLLVRHAVCVLSRIRVHRLTRTRGFDLFAVVCGVHWDGLSVSSDFGTVEVLSLSKLSAKGLSFSSAYSLSISATATGFNC